MDATLLANNIVICYLLRPFEHAVACYWELLRIV